MTATEAPQLEDELCPAMLVENATADTAPEVSDLLHELLADESVPEPMRQDVRARLAALHRRFEL